MIVVGAVGCSSGHRLGPEAQIDVLLATGGNDEVVPGRHFRPLLFGVDPVVLSLDDVIVDPVLDIGTDVGGAPQALRIRVIVREQQLCVSGSLDPPDAYERVPGHDQGRSLLA